MGKVRPQIYETTPVSEIIKQLRREVMPVPFIRRMRVINTLSAVTLQKIEDKTLLPFDVMDIHHVLDKQISQDAIIAILENEGLAIAIDSGDLWPLWEESANLPLLRKGFEQGWIQRFMLLPFDPICIMLALRAKLLLDAVDEFGHSYNLLRTMGMGWIDFGMIEGEEPGDPNSYIPPGIDQSINYPEGILVPIPGDPGYIPGPGDPSYVEPTGVITTFGSAADSPIGPLTVDLSPSSLLGGAGVSVGAMAGGWNCCISIDDPEAFVSIGYFTDEIDPEETLGLTVEHAHEDCDGENYEWLITSGGGELSAETGLDVIFTAPSSGFGCPGKSVVSLFCNFEEIDTLEITINFNYAIAFDYETSSAEIGRETSEPVYVDANNGPFTWSVSGTGFSLEHEETDGTGNVLHADETACGSAEITITGCDEQSAIGYVRCTTGQWGNLTNGCVLSGAPDSTVWNISQLELQKTLGKYKQQQYIVGCRGVDYDGCDATDCSDCTLGACINCTTCLDWSCSETAWGDLDCAEWCCGNTDCGEAGGGYCVGNSTLRYWEWIC